MPLTTHSLEIDQRRPGWGERALSHARALLQRAGLPAMATEVARIEPSAAGALSLERYLRLELTPGAASAVFGAEMFRGDAARSGVYAGEVPERVRQAWLHECAKDVSFSPVVAHDRVVFGDSAGILYCMALDCGAEIWRREFGGKLDTSAACADGRVVLDCGDGFLRCLALEDGAELWSYRAPNSSLPGAPRPKYSPPVLYAGLVYFGERFGGFHCLDLQDGAERWTVRAAGSLLTAPAIWGDRVVFGDGDGVLRCHELQAGRELWRRKLATPGGWGVAIENGVAIAQGCVLVPCSDFRLRCVDLQCGAPLWDFEACDELGGCPAVSACGKVLIGSDDDALYCLDLGSGRMLWEVETEHWLRSSPAVCGGRVVFGSLDGKLRCVDLEDGREIWSFEAGGSIDSSPVVTKDGRILFGRHGANFYCLEAAP